MAHVKNSIMFTTGGGANITVVANYSALPDPTTVSGKFYWCENSQGTSWLPGSLGGTYYNSGMYYSNGTSWSFVNVPYQATQNAVDAGLIDNQFLTPLTFTDAQQLKAIVVSSNVTATLNRTLSVVANSTITDPTPVEGMGYMVTVINGTATIGGVGYTVGQKVFRHFHSGSWRTFVYLDKTIIDTLLANKIDYLIRDFTFSSVTGVTTETLVESYEITAGKIGLNDFLDGFIYTTRTGLANAYTVTLKANTVNNSSTATTIASIATLGNFRPFLPMKFELTVKGGVIIGTTIEQEQGTNYRGQSSAINVPFDNSSNSVYLFLFVTPTNTSSVVQVQSFKLTK